MARSQTLGDNRFRRWAPLLLRDPPVLFMGHGVLMEVLLIRKTTTNQKVASGTWAGKRQQT